MGRAAIEVQCIYKAIQYMLLMEYPAENNPPVVGSSPTRPTAPTRHDQDGRGSLTPPRGQRRLFDRRRAPLLAALSHQFAGDAIAGCVLGAAPGMADDLVDQ